MSEMGFAPKAGHKLNCSAFLINKTLTDNVHLIVAFLELLFLLVKFRDPNLDFK